MCFNLTWSNLVTLFCEHSKFESHKYIFVFQERQHHPRNEGKQHPPVTLFTLISCHVTKKKRTKAPNQGGGGRRQHHQAAPDPKAGREDNRHQAARRDVRRNTSKKEAAKSSTTTQQEGEGSNTTQSSTETLLYLPSLHVTVLSIFSKKNDGREGGTTPQEDGTAAPTKAAPHQRRGREHHSKGRGGRQHHTKEPW